MPVYIVDPLNGDNGDDGLTTGTAWLTVSFAMTQALGGDTIKVRNTATVTLTINHSTFHTGECRFTNSGSPGNQITLRSYDGETALFNLTNCWLGVTDRGYITISLLECTGGTVGCAQPSATINGFRVEFCHVHDHHASYEDNVMLIGVYDCASPVIESCHLHDCTLTKPGQPMLYNDHNSCGVQSYIGSDIQVLNCNIHDCGSGVFHKKSSPVHLSVTVTGCTLAGNNVNIRISNDGDNGDLYYFTNVNIHHNLFLQSSGSHGTYVHVQAILYSNFGGQDDGFAVWNNTFICDANRCFEMQGFNGIEFYNNILYNTGSTCQAITTMLNAGIPYSGRTNVFDVIDNNLYFGPYTWVRGEFDDNLVASSLTTWRSQASNPPTTYPATKDTNSITSNPAFAETVTYTLTALSPAIGAGIGNVDLGWKAFDAGGAVFDPGASAESAAGVTMKLTRHPNPGASATSAAGLDIKITRRMDPGARATSAAGVTVDIAPSLLTKKVPWLRF